MGCFCRKLNNIFSIGTPTDIILDREFEHAITEQQTKERQNYRILVACDVVANLFGHSEQVFDTVYTMIAQLNPDENPLPALEDMDPEEADGIMNYTPPNSDELG